MIQDLIVCICFVQTVVLKRFTILETNACVERQRARNNSENCSAEAPYRERSENHDHISSEKPTALYLVSTESAFPGDYFRIFFVLIVAHLQTKNEDKTSMLRKTALVSIKF